MVHDVEIHLAVEFDGPRCSIALPSIMSMPMKAGNRQQRQSFCVDAEIDTFEMNSFRFRSTGKRTLQRRNTLLIGEDPHRGRVRRREARGAPLRLEPFPGSHAIADIRIFIRDSATDTRSSDRDTVRHEPRVAQRARLCFMLSL